MATFWGCEISSTSPHVHEPDPADELQLTSAVLVSGKGKSFLTVQADESKEMTVCSLVAGSRDQCKLDLLLGGGNDRITFRVSGDKTAVLHLTGYLVVPQEFHQQEDDDEDEGDDDRVLAKNMFGTARLAEDEDDDDDEDEDFEEGDDDDDDDDDDDSDEENKAVSGLFDDEAEEEEDDDDEEEDDDEVRLAEFEEEDDEEEEEEEEPAPKTTEKTTIGGKKRSASSPSSAEASSTPASKKAKVGGPEESFLQSIVSYLSEKGTSPLSKIGNDCKKPAGVKGKLKAFLGLHSDTFEIDGMNVKLKN